MLRTLCLFLFLSLFTSSALAADLLSYLVFSKTSITSHRSDFQGPTGALGEIDLHKFEIIGNLESATRIDLSEVSVRGQARAPRMAAQRSSVSRVKFTLDTEDRLFSARAELDALAMRLSAYEGNTDGVPSEAVIRGQMISGFKIIATKRISVIDIEAIDFEAMSNLILESNDQSLLLIRIHGSHVDFHRKGVFVTKGLRPEQVTFFFPEARSLDLSYSGGARDPHTGTSWGIPGSIVAPNTVVSFGDILVTGKLYVGQLCTEGHMNGGQVNKAGALLLNHRGCGCGPSIP